MLHTCPSCGSAEIVPDLLVFTGHAGVGENPVYVKVVEPEPPKRPFIWSPKTLTIGFRADVCGSCGYTQFYTKHHAELLEAHKQGFTSEQTALKTVLV